jgi:hypothetical protein
MKRFQPTRRKVVDVPVVCHACGNRDWRRFRHRSEDHDSEGKPRRLFAVCEVCGSEHLFDGGQWIRTGVISSEKLRIAALKSGWVQTISDLPGTSRKTMEVKSKILFHILNACQGRVKAYQFDQTNVIKLLNDLQMTREFLAEFVGTLTTMHPGVHENVLRIGRP